LTVREIKTVEEFIESFRAIDESKYRGCKRYLDPKYLLMVLEDDVQLKYSITLAQEAKAHMSYADCEKNLRLIKIAKQFNGYLDFSEKLFW